MAERSTFGPVLLAGLGSGIAVAVAAAQPWVSGSSGDVETSNPASVAAIDMSGVRESPLALSLALVVLACWGVVLVTRGRFRRTVAALAVVMAIGLLITTVAAFGSLPDALRQALTAASGVDTADTSHTGWYAAALIGSVCSVIATLTALRLTPTWPEMGTRYDSPTGERVARAEPEGNLELWKALDEGHDPTSSA